MNGRLHIFAIHSHTTFFSSLGVIKKLNINFEKVIFICGNKYKNKYHTDYKFVDFSDLINFFSPLTLSKVLKLKTSTRLVDYKLKKVFRTHNFIAYVPQLMHPFYQILITNSQCVGYNFIEEGVANYRKELYDKSLLKFSFPKKIIINFLNFFSNRIVLGHLFFGNHKYIKNIQPTYYYYENNFHVVTNNVSYITWPKHDCDISISSDSAIVISSVFVEYKLLTIEEYAILLERLAELVRDKGIKKVEVKFHPRQSEVVKNLTKEKLKRFELDVNVVENEEVLELIALLGTNLSIFGFNSSLLFYLKMLNNELNVYSVNTLINNRAFLDASDSIFTLFKKCGIKIVN